ncbi:unnamed protein product [Moneuplotes crassus]|uniref:Histone deacetylase interacting domain-containing protein n=1 Tax=Euplotes crassus TaxID=5936 RepID=A0AAD1UGY3_EUPCR|nr:unnamed protein product [Moneuplotes crassus]
MKLINAFSNDNQNNSLAVFVELMSKYSDHLQKRQAGCHIPKEEETSLRLFLLQNLSELFTHHDLNEEFTNFLPIQRKGISLLTEVRMKDINLHKKIIEILHNRKSEGPILEDEGQISKLLEKHPEWDHRFRIFLSNNQNQQEVDYEEEKDPLPSKTVHHSSREGNKRKLDSKKEVKKLERTQTKLREGCVNKYEVSRNEVQIALDQNEESGNDASEPHSIPEAQKILDHPDGKSLSKTEAQFFDELKKILADDDLYFDFPDQKESLYTIIIKMFSLYVEGICGADELFEILDKPFKHIDEFEQFKNFCLSREANRRKEDIWYFKNLDETNLKECERIDCSYSTIPPSFPMSEYTGQKGTFIPEVVNHTVVSVPVGSEGNFTFKAKNKHEDALFKIEDERYEIDQCINHSEDCIKALEKATQDINKQGANYVYDPSVITPARLGWIYQCVAKNSKYVDLIKSFPVKVVPIILDTMKKFLSDFKSKKADMQNNWNQECIKHWAKSLDHKCFHFKQNERKTQLTKELMGQMKERILKSKNLARIQDQKEALQFYSGLHSEMEVEFRMKLDIDPDHPMLLADDLYFERFETLPQFRFLINDADNLKLLMKYLYAYIDNQSGQSKRQKDFLISFSKYFLNIGFIKKSLDLLDTIELPSESIELIKSTQTFYKKYGSCEVEEKDHFNNFFSEETKDIVVNVRTNRKESLHKAPDMHFSSQEDILESEPGDSDEEDKEQEKLASKFEGYIRYDKDQEFSKRVKAARFLPLFSDDQTLLFGTKHFYFMIRYFITLYERFVLIKKAVIAKLRKDIAEMKEEKQLDASILETNFEKLVEIRFRYAIGVLFTMARNSKEISVYEDCLRQLLGMQAYILFTFDKAVSNFSRAISSLKNDNTAYESWKLIKKYEGFPCKFKEDAYYNDFIRIIPAGVENEVFFRFVYCSETGIITCHGFNFEPFTSNVALTQKIKDYRREYVKRNEPIAVSTNNDVTLSYKCNENTSKNGSMKILFNPVYLRRNLKKVIDLGKSTLDQEPSNSNVRVGNNLQSNFSHKDLSLNFRQGKEDLIIRKRQKISEEAELETEILNSVKTHQIIYGKLS